MFQLTKEIPANSEPRAIRTFGNTDTPVLASVEESEAGLGVGVGVGVGVLPVTSMVKVVVRTNKAVVAVIVMFVGD